VFDHVKYETFVGEVRHARPTNELPLEQVVHKFKW